MPSGIISAHPLVLGNLRRPLCRTPSGPAFDHHLKIIGNSPHLFQIFQATFFGLYPRIAENGEHVANIAQLSLRNSFRLPKIFQERFYPIEPAIKMRPDDIKCSMARSAEIFDFFEERFSGRCPGLLSLHTINPTCPTGSHKP